MIAIFNSKCHQQPRFPFFLPCLVIYVYSNCLKNKDSPVTGIEPSEDVSIKPVRGKFTKKKHVSEPNTENDAERLPSPNYK